MPPTRPDESALLARVPDVPSDDAGATPLYRAADGSPAAYFAAFPASYWAHGTVLTEVELRVSASGSGRIRVLASDARGTAREVAAIDVAGPAEHAVLLPLAGFDAGGWYWFELDGAVLEEAGWWASVGTTAPRACRPTVAITTRDREAYLLPLLASIARAPEVAALLDGVVVIDHGTRPIVDAEGFAEVDAAFGGRLRVVRQANLGGSGGFSRGMLAALDAGSDAVVLLDDDVVLEPESLRRMIRFEEYAVRPTIVGGHMFDMQHRGRLHALSEGIDHERFFWGAKGPTKQDIGRSGLRATPWLHERGDAEYTGWFLCLIPAEALRSAGLALPLFIKWDDAEYSLRAAEHGVPTVTLPGAAVWHVSWDDKDDTVDWQAYYHSRNRLVAALLHSTLPHGGRAVSHEFALAVRNVLALEYGAQAIRNEAYRDVLDGPDRMHEQLATRLPEIRATLASYGSGSPLPRDGAPVPSGSAPSFATGAVVPPAGAGLALRALALGLRNLLPARRRPTPQGELDPAHTRWWITGRFDAVLVAAAAPDAVRRLDRDRGSFWRLLREARRLTRRIHREWPGLAARYRAAEAGLTSVESWRRTTSAPVDADVSAASRSASRTDGTPAP